MTVSDPDNITSPFERKDCGKPHETKHGEFKDMETNCGATALCYNRTMKRELMQILACPMCKGELDLTVGKEDDREIITGSLYCRKCDERYPIEDTIPNLLPPAMRKS